MLPMKTLGYDKCRNKRKIKHVDDLGDHVENDDVSNLVNEQPPQSIPLDIYDPSNWENLSTKLRDLLVEKGPRRDLFGEKGPKDKSSRCFSSTFYTRYLPNGEKRDREWLVYSKDVDKVFCFCCKLFKPLSLKCQLANEGYGDWEQLSLLLKEHETSIEHIFHMITWKDVRLTLEKNETVDKIVPDKIDQEKQHWRNVLPRIISVVKFLVKHKFTFFGTNDRIYQNDRGNFFTQIEMIAVWDQVMQMHIGRVQNNEIHCHYLGRNIQELIILLAYEIKSTIIKKIKEAKYFSVILDCTLDSNDEKKISLLLRSVDVSTSPTKIEEYFLGFLNVCSGQGLFEELQSVLKSLDLNLDDVRGQGYDHGSNVRGRDQGVQNKLLDINRRAWYMPCGCHSLNLTLCDILDSCSEAKYFFGVIQNIYTLFSHCSKCWKILEDNVKGLTLEQLTIPHYESEIESVRAIRLHALEVREALLQLAETVPDLKVRCQALSLATYGFDFEFLLRMIIWFDILSVVDSVSKYLESKDMLIDVAIDEVKRLINFFEEYKETGFTQAMTVAKGIATEMEIDYVFNETCKTCRKNHAANVNESSTESVEESFRIHYFLHIVDQVIGLLKRMFEQFQAYEDVFGFLFSSEKLNSLDDNNLKSCCGHLEFSLKHGKSCDVDGNDLFEELKFL